MHATSSTSCNHLDHYRVAQSLGNFKGFLVLCDNPCAAWNHGTTIGNHRFSTFLFISHSGHGLGIWTNEDKPRFQNLRRKKWVLCEKTVAWVDRFGLHVYGRLNNPINVQISSASSKLHSLVRHLNMERLFIYLTVYGYCLDFHFLTSSYNPYSNFSSVRNEDLLKHLSTCLKGISQASALIRY